MKVTIKAIAEKAGVHRATVDKVLHNRVGVSDEVRMKVQRIINEMGYTPNPAGRLLQRQGKTYRLAAILVKVDALPFLKLGIERAVHGQVGCDIEVDYFVSQFQDARRQAAYIEKAIDERMDGIILSPINADQVRVAIDHAVGMGIPVVTTNADISGTRRSCCVSMDSLRASRIAGRLMGQFLGGKGKVAVISSAINSQNNNYGVSVREQGFVAFLAENYPEIEVVERIESFEDPQVIYDRTTALLREKSDLQGIYITCGGVAQVGRALCESGCAATIRVLSFEDYPEIVELIQQGVIDCTLAGEIQRQGEMPVRIIMDELVLGRKPQATQIFTETRILVKESLF